MTLEIENQVANICNLPSRNWWVQEIEDIVVQFSKTRNKVFTFRCTSQMNLESMCLSFFLHEHQMVVLRLHIYLLKASYNVKCSIMSIISLYFKTKARQSRIFNFSLFSCKQ